MSDHNFKLLVPLIKRDIYRDENPIGYLIRLAVLNHYESANWLINTRDKRTLSLTFVNAYQLVKSSWNASNMDETVGIQTQLSPMVLNRSNLRFCSLCLKEARYYRMDWQLKSSLVCKKHSVVLQEACPVCLNRIIFEVGRIGYCKCGQDLAESKIESANQFELNLQNFVDGIYTTSITGFSKSSMLSIALHDRIYFIMRLYTWNPIDASTRFKERVYKKISITGLRAVANTFFSTQLLFFEYLLFLSRIETNQSMTPLQAFTLFYRSFYTIFESKKFCIYKAWIEEFILQNWNQPITHRNSLFSKQLIKNYPWITLREASQTTKIAPSVLRRAIKDHQLISTVHKKGKRRYTLVYRDNLSILKNHLNDVMSFEEAKNYLGITKRQLYELLDNKFIPKVIPPREGYSTTWIISRKSLSDVLQSFHDLRFYSNASEDLTLGEAMRVICGRIPLAFLRLLQAIRAKEVRICFIPDQTLSGFKRFRIFRPSLEEWIQRIIERPEYLTIDAFSKSLQINQESAYQLVNYGVIEYETVDGIRLISQQYFDDFNYKYAILSHYAKSQKTSSRNLMNKLAEKDIYPIDHDWDKKLRQKIYVRQHIQEILS